VIDIAVMNPHPDDAHVPYVEGQIGVDQSVLLDCGAFPIQSNCSRIVTQLKNIVIEDTECDKYVDKWMSLNHNEAIRVACENTGSEANSHNYMRRPV
jgi:hypothetical protein